MRVAMATIWLSGHILVGPALFYKYGINGVSGLTGVNTSSKIFWNHPSPIHLLQ